MTLLARPIDFYLTSPRPTRTSPGVVDDSPRATAARQNWKAILLGATFQAAELSPVSVIRSSASIRCIDFERSARFAGVPLKNRRSSRSHAERRARVLVAARSRCRGLGNGRGCFRAYFARGVDLSDAILRRGVRRGLRHRRRGGGD